MSRRRRSRRGAKALPAFEAKHGVKHCREGKLCVECGEAIPKKSRRYRWCSQDCVDAYLVRSSPTDARRAVLKRDRGVCSECGLDTEGEVRAAIKVADQAAGVEFLAAWNLKHPKGIWRRYGYQAPNYERHYGPKTYVGRSPGGVLNKHPGPGHGVDSYDEVAKRHRLVVLARWGFEGHWYRKTFWDMDHIVAVADGGGNCDLTNLRTLCVGCHGRRTARQNRRRERSGATRVRRRPVELCEGGEEICDGAIVDRCLPCREFVSRVIGRARTCGTASRRRRG